MIDNGNGYDIYLIPVKSPATISKSWYPKAEEKYVFEDTVYGLYNGMTKGSKHNCYIAANG